MANSFSVNTYNPADVIFTLGGYQLAGWDDISISRLAPGFRQIRGIRGKHTTVPTVDSSALLTISLIQTSPTNDVLSTIHELDLVEGTGRIALTLKDNSGRSVFSSDEARIISYPEVRFSGDFEYRVWTFFCQTTTYFVGGNTRPNSGLFDAALGSISGLASSLF